MKRLGLLFILFTLLTGTARSQVYVGDTPLDTATLIYGLDVPWEIQWGPDDHIWCTERFGRVSRIHPETGEQTIILDLSDEVFQSGESGLLGMALHPDFDEEPYVYMAYTYRPAGDIFEKIVRYTYQGGELVDEFILLDNIPGNTTHDGCRMIILPDNTLLFSTGDAQDQPAAQDQESLNGKFMRINLDGTIPGDNPFPGNPVYSIGHRNPQGIFLAPNGYLYSSEHGPSTDDELNIIEAANNYGWPNVHGFCDEEWEQSFCDANDVTEPLAAWTPTIATSDIIYYDHPAIPEWQGHILLTTLKNKRIYDLELDETGTGVVNEMHYFTDWWGRLRDILVGPSGEIYLATNGASWSNTDPFTHRIVKVWNPDYVSIDNNLRSEQNKVVIFPNPAQDQINFSVDESWIGKQFSIYSADGQMMISSTIDSTRVIVPLHDFAEGIYLLRINTGQRVDHYEKFIVVKR
ncbi:MAG: PQQ-dependent sugar dehydrogenase [bacterium]